MNKDKKWANNEIEEYLAIEGNNEARNALRFAKGVIDQLDEPKEDSIKELFKKLEESQKIFELEKENKKLCDVVKVLQKQVWRAEEPEILSQEWIDEHAKTWMSMRETERYVKVDDLQNLLVPKQEITVEQAWEVIHDKYGDEVLQNNIAYVESQGYSVAEKVVIPKFVAEWLELAKHKKYNLFGVFEYAPERIDRWIFDTKQKSGRIEMVARAWLDGYEVEKEQKYYVLDKDSVTLLLRENSKDNYIARSAGFSIDLIESQQDRKIYQLTEQEIKDYDERYFAFAKPIEEFD